MKKQRFLVPSLLGAALIFSGMALAQDSAAPAENQAQHQSAKKRHEQTAKEGNPNGGQSTEAGASGSQLSQHDKMFLKKAAQGGIEEVELGQMVQEKAQSQEVKDFAKRMVDDHTKANDELKSLAQQKGYTLPTEMGPTGKAIKAKLEKLSGEQLDRAYMRDMVQDHTKDVAEFKQEAKMAKDSDVKQFAEKTLPVLESHLQEAKKVNSSEKKEASTGKKSSETAQQ